MGIFSAILKAIGKQIESTSKAAYARFMGDLSKMNPKDNEFEDTIYDERVDTFDVFDDLFH